MFFNYYNEKVYYEEFGEGKPILIIHGLACNIELMKGCIEPIFKKVNSYKRIYIDLLGMGKSNNYSLEYASSDKILEMLLSFIKEKIDKEFLLIGESYGGYLSRGIISKCYKNVKGLMLLCSMIIPDDSKRVLPVGNLKFHDKEFLEKMDKNRRKLFLEYMIIANEKMYKRFEKEVISGIEQANNDFIKNNPEVTEKFISALKKGYMFAVDNAEEAADILIKNSPELKEKRDFVLASQKWINNQYVDENKSWGIIDQNRWDAFYQWLYDSKVIDKQIEKGYGFTNEFNK